MVADETLEESAATGEAALAGEETVQLTAEQFESTLEREGVEVFRIRGARTSSDDQGNVLLKEVEIDYPRGRRRLSPACGSCDVQRGDERDPP